MTHATPRDTLWNNGAEGVVVLLQFMLRLVVPLGLNMTPGFRG